MHPELVHVVMSPKTEFEKNVINAVGDPNERSQPHLLELLQSYSQNVQRIFVGDPNIA
jgi:hypothetical protein